MASISTAKNSAVQCQPKDWINPPDSGENTNWPNEPAAVTAPKPIERLLSGSSFASAPTTSDMAQPDRPKPIEHAGGQREQ